MQQPVTGLTDHEILKLAQTDKTHNKNINIEWRKRHSMNYLCKLDLSGNIVNCILNALVGNKECDQMILSQANRLRGEKGLSVWN